MNAYTNILCQSGMMYQGQGGFVAQYGEPSRRQVWPSSSPSFAHVREVHLTERTIRTTLKIEILSCET